MKSELPTSFGVHVEVCDGGSRAKENAREEFIENQANAHRSMTIGRNTFKMCNQTGDVLR